MRGKKAAGSGFRYISPMPASSLALVILAGLLHAIWNIIASSALKKDCDLKISLDELQQIPMDLITWRMENSHRWDLPQDQLNDRFGKPQAIRPIPTPERGISKWNYNTYQYDAGSGGFSEDDGAFFLLPYWMGRYHGYFTE